MPEVRRKSMDQINVTIGGIDISSGGGENDFVTVTAPQSFDTKTGVHRDVVFYDMPDAIYEVTITTLEPMGINRDLQALFTGQLESVRQGPYDFQLEDVGTREELAGQAMIVKEPDRTKAAEAANYEWQIHVAAPDGWQYRARGAVVP